MARSKYTERFCSYCNKQSRMEIVGEMEGVSGKIWFKCTRCRHLSLLDAQANGSNNASRGHIDVSSATPYDPASKYAVGQAIFHSEWHDVGRVVSKMTTSGGGQAIVVAFEKLGERRLIENMKSDVTVSNTLSPTGGTFGT